MVGYINFESLLKKRNRDDFGWRQIILKFNTLILIILRLIIVKYKYFFIWLSHLFQNKQLNKEWNNTKFLFQNHTYMHVHH